jgi:hypothetical protein
VKIRSFSIVSTLRLLSPPPTAFCLLPTVFHSGTEVESTISRRMVSDWSDFFMVER